MKSIIQYSIGVLFLFCFSALKGQISPGKLTQSHSHLEGISNCTQCHTLGEKIAEEKCLNCHTALKSRIQNNKGFHSSADLKKNSCIACHSEHHGTKFQMIRFEKNNFDHRLTGYELQGKHKTQDCKNCHKVEKIQDAEIKKLTNTYLGLTQKCLNCHNDYHQKSLSENCINCHNFEKFKPAINFNHQKTNFPLIGAHQKVDCAACHKPDIKNNSIFVKYSGIDYKSCNACHKDVHNGKYGNNCKVCHQEESFHKIKTNTGFNHSLVGYSLEGKHKVIDCKKCHDGRNNPKNAFKEFEHLENIQCTDCHKDPHESKFGVDCKKCHTVNSFKIVTNKDNFDHGLTSFPLKGKHNILDCKKCHKSGVMTDNLIHDKCTQCHNDYHEGIFAHNPNYNDCVACHTESGFQMTSYDVEFHQSSNFPLEGAHMATDCASCHKKTEKWRFRNVGKVCIDCHSDFHQNYLDKKFYEPNGCASCHITDSWANVKKFDHNLTLFALDGRHVEVQCNKCHFVFQNMILINQVFKGLNKDCETCHKNPHGVQFQELGKTDCKKCHTTNGWNGKDFNHDNTRFPLTGKHISVTCGQCHEPIIMDNQEIILYRNDKLECKDCHTY